MHTLIQAPPQAPPLSSRNTYTSWPGGVDPSASLFKTGGKRTRKQKKQNRKTRYRKQQKK